MEIKLQWVDYRPIGAGWEEDDDHALARTAQQAGIRMRRFCPGGIIADIEDGEQASLKPLLEKRGIKIVE